MDKNEKTNAINIAE